MGVKVEKTLEEGIYSAILKDVTQKETIHGESLMWTFIIPSEDDAEVVGFSSMSPSNKAKAYQWASAIMGEIDPKIGWGPEDVIGGKCRLVLGLVEDSNGVEKNKVEKILKLKASRKVQVEEDDLTEEEISEMDYAIPSDKDDAA
jgi:hypothetical protein